uniref:Uncharacterized protein n=2 Tax=Kalanchoe fedtschenkoi TaxID=63787 RepID=A0A7N0R9K6_KALFE
MICDSGKACIIFGGSLGSTGSMSQNYDERLMQQRVVFTDSLKEMKNLRKQLYSAAEYFELTYTSKDDHQRILVMESLKDYSIKALVNTIDHLGSVASKVENMLDKKLAQVGDMELRFSCVEQRVGAWKELINRQGLAQQMLLIDTPNHHKHYILPVTASKNKIQVIGASAENKQTCLDDPSTDGRDKTAISPLMSIRNMNPPSASLEPSSSPRAFLLMRSASGKVTEGHKVPLPSFPFVQTGTLVNRLTSQNALRSKKQYLVPPLRRSNSSAVYDQKEKRAREIDEYSSRTRRIFRAFVSMRKPNKDVRMQNWSG